MNSIISGQECQNITLPPSHLDDHSKTLYERLNPLLQLLASGNEDNYIGENVSQLEHALQAAHFGAQQPRSNNALVLACLLHDIGHRLPLYPPKDFDPWGMQNKKDSEDISNKGDNSKFMGEYGIAGHEMIGASYLLHLGFSQDVADMVAAHVAVKRYLCAVNPEYHAKLSFASQKTLEYQGGPMTSQEVEAFNQDPLKEQKIQLRLCDEMAKEVDFKVDGLEKYVAMMIDHLKEQQKK